MAGPSKCLLTVLDRLPRGRTLVPGAGRAYDALALAASGPRDVVALDLAPTACAAARDWLATQPPPPPGATVEIVEGNFFTHDLAGLYDLVWDCTFLCALDPTVREIWALRHAELIRPGGELVTLVFPIAPQKVGGPPFHLDMALVRALVEPAGFEEVEVVDFPPGTHMGTVIGTTSSPGNTVVRWRRT